MSYKLRSDRGEDVPGSFAMSETTKILGLCSRREGEEEEEGELQRSRREIRSRGRARLASKCWRGRALGSRVVGELVQEAS